MRSSILSLAIAALLAFSVPAHAQDAVEEETVSDAVDIAIWCGAFYYFASQGAGPETDEGKGYTEMANAAYAEARVALEEDGVEASEYDRIIEYYVELVVEDLSTEGAELRYSEQDCADLIGA
jgi:hypothetical protein